MELVRLLESMVANLRDNPEEWVNGDLESFLGAMAAWVEDMDGYYANAGQPLPEPPGWRTIAEILMAAKHYE
jgi:hypothetical protein